MLAKKTKVLPIQVQIKVTSTNPSTSLKSPRGELRNIARLELLGWKSIKGGLDSQCLYPDTYAMNTPPAYLDLKWNGMEGAKFTSVNNFDSSRNRLMLDYGTPSYQVLSDTTTYQVLVSNTYDPPIPIATFTRQDGKLLDLEAALFTTATGSTLCNYDTLYLWIVAYQLIEEH